MIEMFKKVLWKQFGASTDMLKNAITMWPEAYWDTDKFFFYNAYHCLIFTEYYLTIPAAPFEAKLPFTVTAYESVATEAIDDCIPNRIYTKTELLDYLDTCSEQCRRLIANLTMEKLAERWVEEAGDMNYAVMELLLYNMRHIQHHTAQLNMLLRQKTGNAPGWVSRTANDL